MEEVRRAAGATVFSLFFNALFTLWALFLLNQGLRRFASQIAHNQQNFQFFNKNKEKILELLKK